MDKQSPSVSDQFPPESFNTPESVGPARIVGGRRIKDIRRLNRWVYDMMELRRSNPGP